MLVTYHFESGHCKHQLVLAQQRMYFYNEMKKEEKRQSGSWKKEIISV